MKQRYDSKKTSRPQKSAPYTKYAHLFRVGYRVLDYGGGKYDIAKDYMATKGVNVEVYDPFWRTPAHNKMVLDKFKKKSPDIIICANVLNVIMEDEIVEDVVRKIKKLTGKHTIVIFCIHQGDKSGIGKPTTDGYQRNERAEDYYKFILPYFPTATRNERFWIVYPQ